MGVAGATSANRGRRTSREIAPIGFAAAQMRFVAPPETPTTFYAEYECDAGDSGQPLSRLLWRHFHQGTIRYQAQSASKLQNPV